MQAFILLLITLSNMIWYEKCRMVNYTFSKSFGSDFPGIQRHIEFINVMFWAIGSDAAQDEKRVSELNRPAFAQLHRQIGALGPNSGVQTQHFGRTQGDQVPVFAAGHD